MTDMSKYVTKERYYPPYVPPKRYEGWPLEEIQKDKLKDSVAPLVWSKTVDALAELKELLAKYTDFQRLCLIYRMLADNVRYDDPIIPSSYQYVSVIKRRGGVCCSISDLLFLMCDACFDSAKIYQVSGKVITDGAEDFGHAWNMVQLKEGTFFLDVTADLGKTSWKWFLVGSEQVRKDRSWEKEGHPIPQKKNYSGNCYSDPEMSGKLAEWFTRLGPRFERSVYRLCKDV